MKRVLVAPLDWGLGHATRSIPIIRLLLRKKCEVILAGAGDSLDLLKHEFPQLIAERLPAYNPTYAKDDGMVWKMITQLPRLFSVVEKEHVAAERIIQERAIDFVVSDNRYGCWSDRVPTVLVTHQSQLMMPKRFGFLAPIVNTLVRRKLKNFNYLWVPDYPDRRLTGDLWNSDLVNTPHRFIGPLSRFKENGSREKRFDVAAIFSGPEPQRTMLEEIVSSQLSKSNLKYFIVRGRPGEKEKLTAENVANYMTSSELQQLIEEADVVIARSGYSTILDLSRLQSRAIFVPTPGQTEQLYLARTLEQKKVAYSVSQNKFDLSEALHALNQYSGFRHQEAPDELLESAVDEFLLTKVI